MAVHTIKLRPLIELTPDQFYELCRHNPETKFERNPQGELIIMSPTGGETGQRNSELLLELGLWNRQMKLGVVFDSSTCFQLPGGGTRSPDVAWVSVQRWQSLTPEQQQKFPPLAPDFVLELMSRSDRRQELRTKMQEYQDSGVSLGWLLDPMTQELEVFRLGQSSTILQAPQQISGEPVLPGFMLDLGFLW